MNRCYYAPQYINQNNVLWWAKDDVRWVFAPVIIGILINWIVTGIVIGAIVTRVLAKARNNKPDGYIKHWQYFHLPYKPEKTGIKSILFRDETFPDSSIRHITG